jgi:hypothetical protein
MMVGMNLTRYNVSIYGNFIMKHFVQLIYANKMV